MQSLRRAPSIRYKNREPSNFQMRRNLREDTSVPSISKSPNNTFRMKPLNLVPSLKMMSNVGKSQKNVAFLTETSIDTTKHKEYGFDYKLQDSKGFLFNDFLQKRLKRKRLKKINESLIQVLILNDQEEYQYTLDSGQLGDEKQKQEIGKLIIDPILRDTFSTVNKVDFYQQYKKFDKLDQFSQRFKFKEKLQQKMLKEFEGKMITPRKLGLVDADNITIKPKRTKIRLSMVRQSIFKQTQSVVNANASKAIYFNNHLMGDSYAKICSEAFSSDELSDTSIISLSNNRLTYKSIQTLAPNLPQQLETLDLSNNPVSTNGCQQMEQILQDYKSLQHISLENCKINDQGANIFFQSLLKFGYIKKLNFSKNFIGDMACSSLGLVLAKNKNLQELYLHWNCIRSKGGGIIFRELYKNDTLKVLDISFNSLGSSQSNLFEKSEDVQMVDSVKEIGKYLQKIESSLIHLDISFNSFSREQMNHVKTCVYLNHSLVGFHTEGNASAYLDINGFICFNERDFLLEQMITQKRLIRGVDIQGVIQNRLYKRTDNCWICEGWYEIQFFWQMENEERDQMWIHLDFENFCPILMERDEGGMFYSVKKMCPPLRKVYYFFSNQIMIQYHISSEQSQVNIETYLNQRAAEVITYLNQDNQLMIVNGLKQLNYVFSNQQQVVDPVQFQLLVETLPRGKNRRYIDLKQQLRSERAQTIIRTWSIEGSNFKGFIRDSDDYMDKCFEFDWSMSRISKWVKLEEEITPVKRLFRQHYQKIKEIYRIYSAQQTIHSFPGIPQHIFIEMLQNLGLIDSQLKLQDAELLFLSTNTRELKFQFKPDKQLARFQILEVIFRVAEVKYFRPIIQRTHLDAVTKLLEDLQYRLQEIEIGQCWREKKFWNQSCDFVLKLRQINLKMIFQYFCNFDEQNQLKKHYVTIKDFKHGLMALGISILSKTSSHHMTEIAEKDLAIIFNQSLMTSLDELNYDKHTKMSLVEFQEVLARLADKVNPINSQEDPQDFTLQDRQKQPLQVKLENIISYLMDKINEEQMKKLTTEIPQDKQFIISRSSFEDPEDCVFDEKSSLFLKLSNIGRPSKQFQFQTRRIGIQM